MLRFRNNIRDTSFFRSLWNFMHNILTEIESLVLYIEDQDVVEMIKNVPPKG